MSLTLDECKRKRANIKRNISRIKSIVDVNANVKLSHAELQCRLGILESYFRQALSVQADIEIIDPSDDGRGDLEDSYVSLKVAIKEQLGEDLHSTMLEPQHSQLMQTATSSRLPKLSLPLFDGNHAEFKNFITSFNQIISREYNLTNIEKFNYLLNCLRGPALETVKAFQVTNENYPKAMERLNARYDNPTLTFLETISALFNLQPIGKSNSQQLQSLVDKAAAMYSSMLSIGNASNIAEAMLIYVVMEKCDQQTRNKWNEALDYSRLPSWSHCTQVLERHCQFLQSSNSSSHVKPENPKQNRPSKPNQSLTFAVTNIACPICSSGNHKLYTCPQFKAMAANNRFEAAKKYGLCINCLNSGHQVAHCPSKNRCRTCNRSHHTSLHYDRTTRSDPQITPKPSTNSTLQSLPSHSYEAVTHSHTNQSHRGQIILATAMVWVKDSSGSYRLGRALLDSCSQVSFITDDFAQQLRLTRTKHNVEIRSIGSAFTNIKSSTSTTIKSRISSCELSLEFCITSHIAYQPDAEIDTSNWNLPPNIQLADEFFYRSRRIDILLGTEAFFDLLSVGQIKLGENLPSLQKTLLGWVVSGRYQNNQQLQSLACLMSREESIDNSLQHLWKIDVVETPMKSLQPEHSICETKFTNTTYQQADGRIVVSLAFKDDPTCLGHSLDIARRRFLALERRLAQSPNVRSQYISFMQEYETLGHMSVVTTPKLSEPHYYIPHHCVFKPNSTSTKLRVVFDASCRTSSQRSLNDLLLVGPPLQDDLYMLLLRFRLFCYALTADVTKMYRQVLLNKNDRKYQYILWRTSPDENIQTFELNTVTYGTASAPYLAVRSLQYLADQNMTNLPVGARVVKSSFYVDDLLCGADSIDALHTIKNQVTEVLRRGNFPLAKWHSNHPDFMEEQCTTKLRAHDDSLTSALGVTWHQHHDMLLFSFKPKQTYSNITKRSILSIASSLFDPLGMLSPIVIVAKIILQELWLLKLNWDESVPQHIHQAWINCLSSLNSISSLTTPRYCLQPDAKSIQLHGFCDASIRAYGCGIYVRTEDSLGHVKVQLLTSKSRVAPVKKQSLPKLELCGAHLLAKLYDKIKNIFEGKLITTYFWSDSQIVLHWLQQHSVTLSAFVGNRVSEIQELTIDGQWKYVPTYNNPADIVSRGCTTAELTVSDWFNGPKFLIESVCNWPVRQRQIDLDLEVINKEKRKMALTATIKTNYLIETLNKFSSYNRCIRIVAYMFRFVNPSMQHCPSPSPEEMRHALNCIVWNIQQEFYAEDIRLLRTQKPLRNNLKFLCPFLDTSSGYELIKVGGRLENADLPVDQKHPLLLPSKAPFVVKIVRHLHLRHYHAGPQALIALIRLQFWIVNARDLARSIVRSCVHCVRYRPKLQQQVMGPLPAVRLTPAKPFLRSGVDFCGPINTYLRLRGKGPTKSYIAIFVCLVYKAVHIEVVSDLSTNKFLDALKRMIARRGPTSDIYCDNATNFVGASNKLRALKNFIFNTDTKNAVQSYCSSEHITFHFIPPRAPHFGGLWEAAVKSAKGLLFRTLKNTKFTFEELYTAVVEIEAILNSRPLSPLSSDPNDFGALTAGHFLVGDSPRALPEPMVNDKNINNLDRFHQITALKQQFWRRWSANYINELRSRVKWTLTSPNLTKGTMVIIHDDNLPPQQWRMGRVESVVCGRDDRVRVVHLRTATGSCCRPIHKLAILPVS